jgi:hypothetical protein
MTRLVSACSPSWERRRRTRQLCSFSTRTLRPRRCDASNRRRPRPSRPQTKGSDLECEVLVIICHVAVTEGAMKARQLYTVSWGSLIRFGFGKPLLLRVISRSDLPQGCLFGGWNNDVTTLLSRKASFAGPFYFLELVSLTTLPTLFDDRPGFHPGTHGLLAKLKGLRSPPHPSPQRSIHLKTSPPPVIVSRIAPLSPNCS